MKKKIIEKAAAAAALISEDRFCVDSDIEDRFDVAKIEEHSSAEAFCNSTHDRATLKTERESRSRRLAQEATGNVFADMFEAMSGGVDPEKSMEEQCLHVGFGLECTRHHALNTCGNEKLKMIWKTVDRNFRDVLSAQSLCWGIRERGTFSASFRISQGQGELSVRPNVKQQSCS